MIPTIEEILNKVKNGEVDVKAASFWICQHIDMEKIKNDERDYLASMALQGMLSHATRYKPRDVNKNWHDAIAEEAYEIADAMKRAANGI